MQPPSHLKGIDPRPPGRRRAQQDREDLVGRRQAAVRARLGHRAARVEFCFGDRPARHARAAAAGAKCCAWAVCELLRVCVNSGWHGCVSGRFEAGHYVCAVRGA